MLQAVTIETAKADAERLSPLHPVGAVAALLASRIKRDKAAPIVYIAETSRRRSDIAALMGIMAGADRVAEFPAPDGMPGDGIPASAEAMGRRMSVLRWLCDEEKRPAVVLTTASALVRRVPPRSIWKNMHLEFRVGETIDMETIGAALSRIGYRIDDRVDEPGEAAIRGRVLEIFPAAAPRPCRIEHEDGSIVAIRSFDPVTQRSVAETRHLIIDPASELLPVTESEESAVAADGEVLLKPHYGSLDTLLDYAPDAEILMEDGVNRRADEIFRAIDDVRKERPGQGKALDGDHLTAREWSALMGGRLSAIVEDTDLSAEVPAFAHEADPLQAFAAFVRPLLEDGYRIVVASPSQARKIDMTVRRAGRAAGVAVKRVQDWDAVRSAEGGSLLSIEAPIAEGFLAHEDKIAVVSLRDLLGQHFAKVAIAEPLHSARPDEAFRIGDAVVHWDHGVGILEGLESLSTGDTETEALRLRYANDDTLLVPMSEIGALWRYGGAASDVTLDRLKGKTWAKRRNALMGAVSATAERMVERLCAKEDAHAPVLTPERSAFEAFCTRFPFELTADQASATDAVLADFRSGRPMDRLVCGDVGFGKTEVALRAAAAAVFSGHQVAVVAPTTVLAQQHFLLFRGRFERFGIEVVRLSRLADAAEMKAAKGALADGSASVVVGSHAVLSDDVEFSDLALVVVDEEQRFGAKQKKDLRTLAADIHVLTMTATPIPQTLQAGFVGLHDVSVVATAPSRRRPIRTTTGPFDDEAVRGALLSEKARGGQSFLVCPRIDDLEPMAERLKRLVPDLSTIVLHGKLDAEAADDAMLAFARGEGDVLLSTSIVESGLDVPGANTMIVWRADCFGLAQLHQLRGRVGRGSRRGVAMLVTDPEAEPTPAAFKRLETLCELAQLGAGFKIAARDLDLRGTGELLGEEQAGHLQLVGLPLYRRTLERALVVARGGTPPEDWRPELNLATQNAIPVDYIPEADLRIELAVLLERTEDASALEALRSEIADRFGPLPASLEAGFHLAELRLQCRALGIRRLDAGPKAVAATFSPEMARKLARHIKPRKGEAMRWSKERLILDCEPEAKLEPREAAEALIETIQERWPTDG